MYYDNIINGDDSVKKFILLILCIFAFCACSNKNYIVDTSINKVKSMIDNKETFILYIGSADCSHCATYRPKLEDVTLEYEVTVYYIDTSKLSDDEYNELTDIVNFSGTPTTAFIVDGEDLGVQTHIDGDVSREKIINSFKNNSYIK